MLIKNVFLSFVQCKKKTLVKGEMNSDLLQQQI